MSENVVCVIVSHIDNGTPCSSPATIAAVTTLYLVDVKIEQELGSITICTHFNYAPPRGRALAGYHVSLCLSRCGLSVLM